MHQNGGKLDVIISGCGGSHETAHGAWKNCWILFDSNGASFFESVELKRDIPFVRYPEKHNYLTRLSTLVLSLKGVSGLSNQFDFYTVLDRPYDSLPFLKNLGRSRRDYDFESGI